jgi:hypothetical protein
MAMLPDDRHLTPYCRGCLSNTALDRLFLRVRQDAAALREFPISQGPALMRSALVVKRHLNCMSSASPASWR